MQVDPEFLRKLDPRKSYAPTSLPPRGGDTGCGSRLHGHFQLPANRPDLAVPDQGSEMDSLTTEELRDELQRRQSTESRLEARRGKLIAEIAGLEVEISRLLGEGASSR